MLSYEGGPQLPLTGPPLRRGEVLHLVQEEKMLFETVTLCLFANGIAIEVEGRRAASMPWSPFSLVQACRLHTVEADEALPWLRLFKVSIFGHCATHFFATRGDEADTERARWVADIARGLRVLTLSLFHPFDLCVEPLAAAPCTAGRLLAGYVLEHSEQEECFVKLVYLELHAHWNNSAVLAAYEDETCEIQVMRLHIDVHTCVSERVGVDCSCFSVDGHLFSTRTCAEKSLWLRAVSNVKVKLRHGASNPTEEDLRHYRAAVLDSTSVMRREDHGLTRTPLLPRCAPSVSHASASKLLALGASEPPMTAAGDRHDGPGFAAVPPVDLGAQVDLGEEASGPSSRGVTPREREARRPPPVDTSSLGTGGEEPLLPLSPSMPPPPRPPPVDTSSFGMHGEEPLLPLSPSMPPPPRSMGPSVRRSTPPLRHEPGADDDDDDFLGASPLVAPDIAPSEPCRQPRASGQPRESGHPAPSHGKRALGTGALQL